jgi:hypothetical protein
MELFDTLTWAEILVKTTFLGTPTLTVLCDDISRMNFGGTREAFVNAGNKEMGNFD